LDDLQNITIDLDAPIEGVPDMSFLYLGRMGVVPSNQPKPLHDLLGVAIGRQNKEQNRASIDRFVNGRFKKFRNFYDLIGKERGNRAIIVAGGPSITETLPDIRARLRLSKKTRVIALNKSDGWLRQRGIVPDYTAMCDPGEWVADYVAPDKRTKYLFASQLHEKTLAKFEPFRASTYIWHCDHQYEDGETDSQWADKTYSNVPLPFLGNGSTIGILSIYLASVMGFDDVEIHGLDGCFHPDRDGLHAYAKPNTVASNIESTVKSCRTGDAFKFVSNVDMARQCQEFGRLMENPGLGHVRVSVAGRGVIPWLVWKDGGAQFRHANPKTMERFAGQQTVDYRPQWSKS
jgi:hypothetical protein